MIRKKSVINHKVMVCDDKTHSSTTQPGYAPVKPLYAATRNALGAIKNDSEMTLAYGLARDYAARHLTRNEADILIRKGVPSTAHKDFTGLLDTAYASEHKVVNPGISDRSLARYCLQQAQGRIKVLGMNKKFMYWTGSYWDITQAEGHVEAEAKKIMAEFLERLPQSERSRYASWLDNMKNFQFLLEALRLEADKVIEENLNSNPDLLLVRNGAYSLESHRLEHPAMANYQTNREKIKVEYLGKTAIPLWREFIAAIADDDEEMVQFLQILSGYILGTKTNYLEYVFVLVNQGGNGASCFLKMLRRIMGTYAATLPAEFLTFPQAFSADYSAFATKRLLTISDADIHKPLASNRLLAIAKGAPLTGYHSQQGQWIDYLLQGKVLMETHGIPPWADEKKGVDDHVLVIPLQDSNVTRDNPRHVQNMMIREESGILHWMIEGYALLQKAGGVFRIPNSVY